MLMKQITRNSAIKAQRCFQRISFTLCMTSIIIWMMESSRVDLAQLWQSASINRMVICISGFYLGLYAIDLNDRNTFVSLWPQNKNMHNIITEDSSSQFHRSVMFYYSIWVWIIACTNKSLRGALVGHRSSIWWLFRVLGCCRRRRQVNGGGGGRRCRRSPRPSVPVAASVHRISSRRPLERI